MRNMRILCVAGASPATIFGLVPLATAARNRGHEVVMASSEGMMPLITGAGLAGVPCTDKTMLDFFENGRGGEQLRWPTEPVEHMVFIGAGFGRLAAESARSLEEFARDWKADAVVGGWLSFSAALVARRLGLPWIRHAWDLGEPPEADAGAERELLPELKELGLDSLPTPEMTIEVCPPSLRRPDAPPSQGMRWLPCGPQRRMERWMYTRGDRRRVCVTAGSRVGRHQYLGFLKELVDKVDALGDVEIVVPVSDEVAPDVSAGRDHVLAGWMPLEIVAPTCDLFVHHAGGSTSLTAVAAGAPQLLLPNMPKSVPPSRRLVERGAALILDPGTEDSADAIAASARELLEDPSYARRTRDLGEEIRAQASPSEVVAEIERLRA